MSHSIIHYFAAHETRLAGLIINIRRLIGQKEERSIAYRTGVREVSYSIYLENTISYRITIFYITVKAHNWDFIYAKIIGVYSPVGTKIKFKLFYLEHPL